jgi:hypothetical protein
MRYRRSPDEVIRPATYTHVPEEAEFRLFSDRFRNYNFVFNNLTVVSTDRDRAVGFYRSNSANNSPSNRAITITIIRV